MKVGFARPSITTLGFFVLGRSIHPELFNTYRHWGAVRPGYTATVRICDAGHTVSFQAGDSVLTEVVATRDQLLPQKKRLLEKKLFGHRDESFEFESGLRYQVSYQLEEVAAEVYTRLHEELMQDARTADLAHEFPTGHRLAPGPISLIRTEADAKSLLVHAFHTFPESSAIVRTQSLFEIG